MRRNFQSQARENSVAYRIADYFAAIAFAGTLAHDVLGLPWDPAWVSALFPLHREVSVEAEDADRAKVALEFALSWAESHQSEFFGRNNGKPSFKGWAGRWDKEDDWQFIAYFPNLLKKLLANEGFDHEAVLRSWEDREWLETDHERGAKRRQKKVRIDGANPRLIAIRRSAIDELFGDTSDQPNDVVNNKDHRCAKLGIGNFQDD